MDKFIFTKSGMFRNDDGHYYAVTDVDTRIADATARIGRQEARLMYLERRLFECESAMLMGHDAGRIKYMNEYPEPMEAPSAN